MFERPSVRARLDSFRRRFPAAYWRARNGVALVEWWWARRQAAPDREQDDKDNRGRDVYDDAFWDFHGTGDWEGLGALILRYCPARSVVDVGCGQGILLEGFRRVDPSLA